MYATSRFAARQLQADERKKVPGYTKLFDIDDDDDNDHEDGTATLDCFVAQTMF